MYNIYIKHRNIIFINLKKNKLKVNSYRISWKKAQASYRYLEMNGLKNNNISILKEFGKKKLNVFFISNINMIETKWGLLKTYDLNYKNFQFKKKKNDFLKKMNYTLKKFYNYLLNNNYKIFFKKKSNITYYKFKLFFNIKKKKNIKKIKNNIFIYKIKTDKLLYFKNLCLKKKYKYNFNKRFKYLRKKYIYKKKKNKKKKIKQNYIYNNYGYKIVKLKNYKKNKKKQITRFIKKKKYIKKPTYFIKKIWKKAKKKRRNKRKYLKIKKNINLEFYKIYKLIFEINNFLKQKPLYLIYKLYFLYKLINLYNIIKLITLKKYNFILNIAKKKKIKNVIKFFRVKKTNKKLKNYFLIPNYIIFKNNFNILKKNIFKKDKKRTRAWRRKLYLFSINIWKKKKYKEFYNQIIFNINKKIVNIWKNKKNLKPYTSNFYWNILKLSKYLKKKYIKTTNSTLKIKKQLLQRFSNWKKNICIKQKNNLLIFQYLKNKLYENKYNRINFYKELSNLNYYNYNNLKKYEKFIIYKNIKYFIHYKFLLEIVLNKKDLKILKNKNSIFIIKKKIKIGKQLWILNKDDNLFNNTILLNKNWILFNKNYLFNINIDIEKSIISLKNNLNYFLILKNNFIKLFYEKIKNNKKIFIKEKKDSKYLKNINLHLSLHKNKYIGTKFMWFKNILQLKKKKYKYLNFRKKLNEIVTKKKLIKFFFLEELINKKKKYIKYIKNKKKNIYKKYIWKINKYDKKKFLKNNNLILKIHRILIYRKLHKMLKKHKLNYQLKNFGYKHKSF